MKLWNYIKEYMLRHPHQTIGEGNSRISYGELVSYAHSFAQKLEGVECAAILCSSEMACAMALLSCFAAETTAVPMSVRYGEAHCKNILKTISPTAVISDADGELDVRYLPENTYRTPPAHPALIMCTSGTTGMPKGVMLSEKNILTNLRDVSAYLNIDDTDTILISRPIYHCAVLTGEFLVSLVKGAKIRFYSEQFNACRILKLIERERITVFCSTPTVFSVLSRISDMYDVSSLKVICISGECMSADTGKRIARAFKGVEIYHVYGLTEACPRVSYLSPELFPSYPSSVGVPLASVTAKVVAEDGDEASANEDGMLWIRGDNIMLGYYNAPEQTKRVLRDGWLCTGDTAYRDKLGLLYIKGRSDGMIIRAGMNIYPQEIESALKADERVREVLVYGRKSESEGQQICMKIAGDFADIAEVKSMCFKLLPKYTVPTYIELVDSIPKNGSGKIIRGGNNA